MRNRLTSQWKKYWAERKIDWKTRYFDTQNHPHRKRIIEILSGLKWFSLFEIGMGAGANLVNIVRHFKQVQVGGIDVSEDAVEVAKRYLNGALLKVGSVEDIMLSDNSVDIVLSDMALMYVDPFKIDKVLEEIKRVGRSHVVFCELVSKNWWQQLKMLISSGYHAHQYKKLLEKHDFYNIIEYKLTKEDWPEGDQEKFGYIITAKINKKR